MTENKSLSGSIASILLPQKLSCDALNLTISWPVLSVDRGFVQAAGLKMT